MYTIFVMLVDASKKAEKCNIRVIICKEEDSNRIRQELERNKKKFSITYFNPESQEVSLREYVDGYVNGFINDSTREYHRDSFKDCEYQVEFSRFPII